MLTRRFAEVRERVRHCLGEELEHVECRLPGGDELDDAAEDGEVGFGRNAPPRIHFIPDSLRDSAI